MKERTCCFTGHRKIDLLDYIKLKYKLKLQILLLVEKGIIYFGVGGARGFDLLAAETILKMKRKYPQIRLIIVLPCNNHYEKWSKKDKKKYFKIEKQSDKKVYISDKYYMGCMQKRNRHLVDNSKYCIAYKRREYGGTAYTVKYAKMKNLEIINI